MDVSKYLIPFEQCDNTMVNRVGGKCASLGELLRAHIQVPPGYAITTDTYKLFLEENDLSERIEERLKNMDRNDVAEGEEASRNIRSWIEQASISEPLEDLIAASYQRLSRRARTPAVPVAVRSSATAEDLPGASFAGQQDT